MEKLSITTGEIEKVSLIELTHPHLTALCVLCRIVNSVLSLIILLPRLLSFSVVLIRCRCCSSSVTQTDINSAEKER